jgi:opacity protein-like surface antigen
MYPGNLQNYQEEYFIMQKTFQCLIVTALLVLGLNISAHAAGYYIGFLGGGSFLPESKANDALGSTNFSFDGGFDGSISLGYDLGTEYPKIGRGRVELEFNKASNDLDEANFIDNSSGASGSAERTSIMLNTIGEYKTQKGIIIYALLGIGWAEIYQAGLGLAWKFLPHFFFDVSYRYYGTTDPSFTKHDGDSIDYEYDSHRLLAGLRLHF